MAAPLCATPSPSLPVRSVVPAFANFQFQVILLKLDIIFVAGSNDCTDGKILMTPSHQSYDVVEQYRTSGNLDTRINLHERFSKNTYGWTHWVFDQIELPAGSQILELGCGVGKLWLENRERIPESWQLILSDFSLGMLESTQRNLQDLTSALR